MQKLMEQLSAALKQAFAAKGYDEKYGEVAVSNRPDLCQYQCNGALAAAKQYKKAPIMIANEVLEQVKDNPMFADITAIMPGFINIKVSDGYLAQYLEEMAKDDRFGCDKAENPKTIVIDYGGPNVAKPLHIGHLRSAIIGESIKRIGRFMGHTVIGDVHLGDWGLQMGLIITELKKRQPDLVYFDDSYTGEYPTEAPFTLSELEEIYPAASAYSKTDPEFKEEAEQATFDLQKGKRGYEALWQHIMNVSLPDLKRNYDNLNVSFDLWKSESSVKPHIAGMVEELQEKGFTRFSQGALIIDVKEETDTKEIPPYILIKSNGASLYSTTDLATMKERMELHHPDSILYVADKRQEMHFTQCFRCAKKTGIVPFDTALTFLGFGTMNGKDGKPFKTRDGGVMRLETLIENISDAVYEKMMQNREMPEEEARGIAAKVGLAAIKYGDLSNQAAKDYIFDIDRFISFEGNTGPYILYTIVRIKSILAKYKEQTGNELVLSDLSFTKTTHERGSAEVDLMLQAVKFNDMMEHAYEENAPHKVCQYMYELANAFNSFYHENKILSEEDAAKKESWMALILTVLGILSICINLLGIESPDRM